MKNKKNRAGSLQYYLLAAVFWLAVWQIAAMRIDRELFLPSPLKVWSVLCGELLPSGDFWRSIIFSFLRIGAGFAAGFVTGTLLAGLSYLCRPVRILLWLPIKVIKAIPVASFVILTLLWMDSSELSVFIPFLMVLPILYLHTFTALSQTDRKLAEMASLFCISPADRLFSIYLPQILPAILSACSLASGMAWKSGIAAEIIGLSRNSIGNRLYQAKIYLLTPELFAWTIIIILLSIGWEQLFRGLAGLLVREKKNPYRNGG